MPTPHVPERVLLADRYVDLLEHPDPGIPDRGVLNAVHARFGTMPSIARSHAHRIAYGTELGCRAFVGVHPVHGDVLLMTAIPGPAIRVAIEHDPLTSERAVLEAVRRTAREAAERYAQVLGSRTARATMTQQQVSERWRVADFVAVPAAPIRRTPGGAGVQVVVVDGVPARLDGTPVLATDPDLPRFDVPARAARTTTEHAAHA